MPARIRDIDIPRADLPLLAKDTMKNFNANPGDRPGDYTERMLSWESGPRPTDGCWGPHWYGSTLESTGFARYRAQPADLPARCEALAGACEDLYAELHEHAIRPRG